MCGRWYLPMFLLRDGLLTLMYKASLMVLMRFWSSLPTIVLEIIKIKIFLRPEEAMFGNWQRLVFV